MPERCSTSGGILGLSIGPAGFALPDCGTHRADQVGSPRVFWFVLVLCCFVGLGLQGCDRGDAAAGAPRSASAPEVQTVTAWTGDIEIIVRSVGQVRAVESVTLTSEVAGLVREIRFDEGSTVQAGDLIVQIDDTRARAEYDSARAVRDRAKRQLERFERAATTAAASVTEIDSVRTDLALAEAQYELARIRVQDHRIVAPFAGRVGLRTVSTGSYIQPGTALTTLTTVDPVDIEFDIPELYLGSLRPGLDVSARAQAYDREFPATVRAITPEVNPSTRSALVLARATNAQMLLRPGMFVNVSLVLGQRSDAVIVPEASLQFQGSQVSLFVVSGDEVRARRVRVGERRGANAEIIEGLEAGEQIVVAGLQRIRDGARVRAVPVPRHAATSGPAARAAAAEADRRGPEAVEREEAERRGGGGGG